jgi:large subunit ribosomal protein L5
MNASKKQEKKETKTLKHKPKIDKITVNIGLGEAGERLKKAEGVLQDVTGQKPVQTISKTTNKDLGVRKGMPLGCKVTLRNKKADEFFKKALKVRENKIADYSFDDQGNLSFGIPDHTMFEDQKYDPNVGLFGMDVCITMKKPGYRVKKRRIQTGKIPKHHQVTVEESMDFFKTEYNVEVVE